MKRLTENEILFANLVKAMRAKTRLKHSLAADRELYAKLPDLEEGFWQAVQLGEEKKFVLESVMEDEDEDS